ncbi:hypothetical protein CSA80_02830 [Candidatus Saccharibacteria bacterium]|nr:MAG: hypothetical protein CR973_02950 [Candidatus Saccharibacteria bacterium]PID99026.1 MAG: hypothetical protein CSA80_02830 [Candidatus Saccharibacteria bacterium]
MDNKKLSFVLAAAMGLLVVALFGSVFYANQILTEKSRELSKLKAQSQVTDELQTSLKKNKADIIKYAELNRIAKAVVPQDKNQAQTVGEIVKIANDSTIPTLSSITFPASTLGGKRSAKSSRGLTQVTPVKGISGVYILPITITQSSKDSVSYPQFITFLKKLENNQRTAQVSSVNISPNPKNPNNISFTLTVNEYIKP